MSQPEVKKTQLSTLIGIFFLIMMAVFAAEVTVMQVYGGLFERLAPLQRAFLDSSSLILMISPPLWFFVFRPAFRERITRDVSYSSLSLVLFIKVLAGLYLIQLLIMLVLPELMTYLPPKTDSLVDGILTVIFSAPLFWWLLYRLELQHRKNPLVDFLNTPITLYILLLFMIFLADIMQEILFPIFETEFEGPAYLLADGLVTVLFISPLLLILVVKPLRRLARLEKARTDEIYDQVIDGIVKIDQKGIIRTFNIAASNIFGYQAEEMIGNSATLLFNSGAIDLTTALTKLQDGFVLRPIEFRELSALRKDGEKLVLNATLSKVQLEGTSEFLLFIRDISERKAAEDALLATDAIFREIFNQTEDAIIFFEPGSGEILDVNTTMINLYGYTKRELQEQGAKLFCGDHSLLEIGVFLAKIDMYGTAQLDSLQNTCSDGQKITVSIRGKMMSLQGARVVFATIRDISERIKLERESQELQSKMIHTNKMTSLGLMVSGVAHEINNPNNYVLSNAQLLSRIWKDAYVVLNAYYREHGEFLVGGMPFTDLENHAPELFQGISDGSRRINAIVNNLKQFVRQGSSQSSDEVDLNEVAKSAVSMLKHEMVKYTDDFQVFLADDLPMIRGSAQQLGQVLTNLLMNACQALPEKSCKIWLATEYEPQRQQVRVSVRDEGIGLPEDLKEKILDPFFTTKLDSGGTGLGLSISQTIIKEHGGYLDFYSVQGEGTTFTVTLPADGTTEDSIDQDKTESSTLTSYTLS